MLRGNNKQHWYNRRLTLTVQVPKISGYWGSALTAAAQASALDFATLLLDIGVDVNAEGGEYHTALQAAVFAGDSSVVKLLLEHKADPYVVGGKFGTALLAASSASNTEALRLLLEAGATVNKIGGSYGSALIAAIEAGNLTCVEALLDHGANPDLPLHDNDAPVQIAARKDLLSILELLVDRGADLQVIDEDGRTITMLALSWNSHSIVEYLLKRDDIVLDKTDAAERTPLMIAVRQGSDFVGTLLKKGADPNARDWQGKTPLVQAVMMDFQEVVTTLLDHGADPTLADSRGRGPLYWACRRGSVEMFDSVLSALKIWKECSTRCERALHAAVAASRSDFISKLLEIKHTRPNEPGEDNWTPIYTAQRYARGSIVGQLSAAGGIDTDLVDVVGRRKWPSKWHPSDRSSSLRLSDDLMTVTTGGPPNPDNMPEPCGVILADYPMPGEGIFYFEVKIDNAPKSRLIGVGFCEEDAALNEMLGFNQASWGYHGDDGHQFSGEIGSRWGPRYQTGEVIGCGVDFDKHIAFYTKNGEVIGRAFSGSNEQWSFSIYGKLYPAVSLDTTEKNVAVTVTFWDQKADPRDVFYDGAATRQGLSRRRRRLPRRR